MHIFPSDCVHCSKHWFDSHVVFSLCLTSCLQPMSLVVPLHYFVIDKHIPVQGLCSLLTHSSAQPHTTACLATTTSMLLTSIHESDTAFSAFISVTLPSNSGTASGLTVTSDSTAPAPSYTLASGMFHPHYPADPAARSAHKVCINIARPIQVSLELNLPWPVTASSICAKLARSTGKISLVLPKAKEWPQDWTVLGLVQQVGVSAVCYQPSYGIYYHNLHVV